MSATEILEELPKLSLDDLQVVHERILELKEVREIEPSAELNAAIALGLESLENEPTISLDEARRKVAKASCAHLSITKILENIRGGTKPLSLREQVEVARHAHRLSARTGNEREDALRRTHGALDEADGLAFEEAMNESRRMENHG